MSGTQREGISYEYQDAASNPSHAYLLPAVNKLLENLPPGSKVLDLGCGNGSVIAQFQDRGWKLYGTDFSPTGIEQARANYPSIEFFLADASAPTGQLLERVGAVDAVISTEVIEHVYNPRGFIQNAFSVLQPGGFLIVSTPYNGYLKNLIIALTGKFDKHVTVLWDHGHIKFWSRKTLRTVLEEAGFVDFTFLGAGRLPWLWKSMVVRVRRPS